MQTVVARAPMIDEHFFSPDTEVIVTKDHVLDFMKHARAGVIKSGTSTLQAGLLNLPMVIVYKTSKLTYWIGRRLISIGSIGLANIVAGKAIVPEIIQDDMTAEKLTKELDALLQPAHEAEIKRELSALREKLGAKSAAKNAALAIGAMIDGQG
jgi:lipid-A-disaccharide synthase